MQAVAAAFFWLLCVLGTYPLARCGRAGKFAAAGASRTLWSPEAPRKAAPAFLRCAGFFIFYFEGRRGRGKHTCVGDTRMHQQSGVKCFPRPEEESPSGEWERGALFLGPEMLSEELVQGSPAGVSASFPDGSGREAVGEFS